MSDKFTALVYSVLISSTRSAALCGRIPPPTRVVNFRCSVIKTSTRINWNTWEKSEPIRGAEFKGKSGKFQLLVIMTRSFFTPRTLRLKFQRHLTNRVWSWGKDRGRVVALSKLSYKLAAELLYLAISINLSLSVANG